MIFDVERIVTRIEAATYKARSYSGNEYDKRIIDSDGVPALRAILVGELGDLSIKMAELEAKCFAYEAIIQNSNFKPVIERTKTNPSKAADMSIPEICKDCNSRSYEYGFDAGYEAGKKDFDLNTKIAAAEAESEGHDNDG